MMLLRVLVVAVCAIGRTAAGADVSIAVDQETIVAPATVTLSAKTNGEDVIVSHRWTGLPNAPRCREESCVVELPVASCTAVELEIVTLTGDTKTATRALCANDDQGGEPPRLSVGVTGGRVVSTAQVGSSSIVIRRAWLDGVENTGSPLNFTIEETGGCHAIDVFVADIAGRYAIAQKTVCFEADSPELWIGGKPSTFVPVGDRLELCVESVHPLDLPMMKTAGDAQLDGCVAGRVAPPSLSLSYVTVADSNGVESTASAFLAAVPSDAPPVLFFASTGKTANVEVNEDLEIAIQLYGGKGPFNTDLPRSRVVDEGPGSMTVLLERVPGPIGTRALSFVARDARGLEAKLEIALTVKDDPIHSDPPNNSNSLDAGAACRCLRAVESASHLHFALVFVALLLIRRGRR